MSKIIESIDYFPAGYCTSYTGLLFKGIKNKKMTFPAGVFLIKHREKGYLLYDTGYHYDIRTQIRYGFYRLGTPVQMTEKDQISYLLKAKGIKPEEINYIILSHLHPDHLGGASFFPHATFILTQEVYDVYKKPTLKDLIFKEFLPASFEKNLIIIRADQQDSTFPYRPTSDLFGDGSILVASVDERAERRYKENIAKGIETDLETLKEEIAARDYKDSHRETSPLKQAEDAVYLDTTGLNIQEVVEKIKAEAKKRMS